MKFNLKVTIDEFVEQHTHVVVYDEVSLSFCRGTGETFIRQGDDAILLELGQGRQLYMHLKSVFGD